jgi:hypothetical protein
MLRYVKPERIFLKNHPQFDERQESCSRQFASYRCPEGQAIALVDAVGGRRGAVFGGAISSFPMTDRWYNLRLKRSCFNKRQYLSGRKNKKGEIYEKRK